MKTIKQQEEIAFNAISFKDAIVLLPLMDELVKIVNNNRLFQVYANLPKEEREKYQRVWQNNNVHLPDDSVERILNLLNNLGFESQIDLKDCTINDLKQA
jgi:hypothetical protein